MMQIAVFGETPRGNAEFATTDVLRIGGKNMLMYVELVRQ